MIDVLNQHVAETGRGFRAAIGVLLIACGRPGSSGRAGERGQGDGEAGRTNQGSRRARAEPGGSELSWGTQQKGGGLWIRSNEKRSRPRSR
jgi:hypothetical protein